MRATVVLSEPEDLVPHVSDLLRDGVRHVTIDVSDCEPLSSGTIAILLRCAALCQACHVPLTVRHVRATTARQVASIGLRSETRAPTTRLSRWWSGLVGG